MTTPSFFITPGYGTRLHDALHYSQAMRIGDRVEISGQGGWNDDLVIPESIEEEIEQAFKNVERTLAVDIHRLFDKFLISINPETLRVVISASLTTCYKELSYVKLPLTTTNLTRKLLQRHYDTFKKTESYTVQ